MLTVDHSLLFWLPEQHPHWICLGFFAAFFTFPCSLRIESLRLILWFSADVCFAGSYLLVLICVFVVCQQVPDLPFQQRFLSPITFLTIRTSFWLHLQDTLSACGIHPLISISDTISLVCDFFSFWWTLRIKYIYKVYHNFNICLCSILINSG